MGLYSSVCASNYYMDSVWVYNCTGILPEASIYPVFPSLDYSLSTYSSMSFHSLAFIPGGHQYKIICRSVCNIALYHGY